MKAIPILALLTVAACSPQSTPQSTAAMTAAVAATAKVPAGAYTLDTAHASLVFRVNHMGFSHYTAQFKKFTVQLQFDPKRLTASSVAATIDPRSLDLDNPPAGFVDALLGEQWLDATKYPEMTFKSSKLESTGVNSVRAIGDFTLHGVTKPVALEIQFNGGYPGHPMDPHARIGFSAHGSLKRSEFGIAYGIPEPGSNMGVSDEVQVAIEAELSGPPLVNGEQPKEK